MEVGRAHGRCGQGHEMKFIARRGESTIPVEVERLGGGYQVTLGERVLMVDLIPANGHLRSLRLRDGKHYLLTHQRDGNVYSISFGGREVQLELLDPLAFQRARADGESAGEQARVTAAMPGRVVRVLVEQGSEVKAGDSLVILEAMKMENEITAPRAGKVTAVHVQPDQTVETGTALVEIE